MGVHGRDSIPCNGTARPAPLQPDRREQRRARRRRARRGRDELQDAARREERRAVAHHAERAEDLMRRVRRALRRARRRQPRRRRTQRRRSALRASHSHAATRASVAAASSAITASASGCDTAWKLAIARPNWRARPRVIRGRVDEASPRGGEIRGRARSARAPARASRRRARAPHERRRVPTARRRASRPASIAPRASASHAASPSISTKICASGAHGSSGGVPTGDDRLARSRRARAPRPAAAASRRPSRRADPDARARPSDSHRRHELDGAALAFRRRDREHAERGELAPQRVRERAAPPPSRPPRVQRSRQKLATRVGDRLLRVVEAEIETGAHDCAQRAAATARRCAARPPSSRRSAGSRMLKTCRSCSRV